jgi:transcriptional regulator with XRE-family HTH domain
MKWEPTTSPLLPSAVGASPAGKENVPQEALADYLKMHRTFIGHLETGRKDFRLTTLIRVAEALGVPLSELFTGLESGASLKAKLSVYVPSELLVAVRVRRVSVWVIRTCAFGMAAPLESCTVPDT